jgi:DNA-binding NarL/FixJ family response regulator
VVRTPSGDALVKTLCDHCALQCKGTQHMNMWANTARRGGVLAQGLPTLPAMAAIRILLVEDDSATRDWLTRMLADMAGTPEVQACADATSAIQWLGQHRPDIVLTDLGLPDRPGTEVIRAAAQAHPGCDILVITIFGDEQHVVAALEAGASGYLLKDSSLDNIREHLDYLRQGGSPMTPRIARLLIRQYRSHRLPFGPSGAGALDEPPSLGAGPRATGDPTARPPGASPPVEAAAEGLDALSQRELEVLTGIAKGFSYAEVAATLGVSTNTVRSHVKRLYGKLSVNSGAEAVYEFNQRRAQLGQPPLV